MKLNLKGPLTFLVAAGLQLVLGLVCVLGMSLFYPNLDATQMHAWLFMIVIVWWAVTAGIFMGGMLMLRFTHQPRGVNPLKRLVATGLGVMVPFLILAGIGLSIGPGDPDAFSEQVLTRWQPVMAFLALGLGVASFYIPGPGVKEPEPEPEPKS